MNEHSQISDLLPLYVSGALDRDQRAAVEQHLPGCPECQADLALWRSVSAEIVTNDQALSAPRGLAEQALAQAEPGPAQRGYRLTPQLAHILQLLRSQMPLVQREIWPASAAVIALGYVIAVIAEQSGVIYALAPLIAAACVSLIYGPENDPAFELARSTPTSPRQILLARLVLVFGYNLVLALVATLGLLPVFHQPLAGSLGLIAGWLAPTTFLSATALVLSLWIGAPNAISITYAAWLALLMAGPLRSLHEMSNYAGPAISPELLRLATAYQSFWQNPGLLLGLSALLFALALWSAGRQEDRSLHTA